MRAKIAVANLLNGIGVTLIPSAVKTGRTYCSRSDEIQRAFWKAPLVLLLVLVHQRYRQLPLGSQFFGLRFRVDLNSVAYQQSTLVEANTPPSKISMP